jgi:hypothetical protein
MIMTDSIAHRLIRRYDSLLQDSANFRNMWQDLADYIQPSKNTIVRKTAPGQKRTDRVLDSTAIVSNNRLAAFIAGSLTNMTIKWFSLKLDDEDLNNNQEVLRWLDRSRDVMLKWFRSSNFNTESQEVYRDLGGFGTGCLLHDEKPRRDNGFGGFMFRAEACGSYVVAENPDGRVDSIWRLIQLTPMQLKKRWGIGSLSKPMQAKLAPNSPDMDTFQNILHVVLPREDVPSGGITQLKMPYASYYIEQDQKHIIAEGGYHEFPFYVPRWAKSSGEVYGRGPGNDAYPDIRSLNKAMELIFKAWGKAIDPPVNVLDDGVVGRVTAVPAGVNIVRDKEAIMPWPITSRFDVNPIMLQDLRSSIRSVFFSDQLQLPDKTIITATEVERRLELMQQVLGPTVGRLEYEFLAPLIQRSFSMLYRAKEIADPPAIVMSALGGRGMDISVQYEGPLARAQRSNDSQAISRLLSFLAPMAQLNPEVLDNLDFDKMVRVLAAQTGVPSDVIKDATDVKRVRKIRAAQQEQMAQAQMGEHGAKAAQSLADAAATIGDSEGGRAVAEQLAGGVVPQEPE